MNDFFDKFDLYNAYKKVKYELFNDNNSFNTIKLYNYEKNLNDNIDNLYNNIKYGDISNLNIDECSYYEVPKSFEDTSKEKSPIHFFSSSIEHQAPKSYSNIALEFRKVIDAEVDIHIISALWILKVGQFIDEKFNNDIYGSRLIRIKPSRTSSCEFDLSNQKYNIDSPRIFEAYHGRYKSWRNNSFDAIRKLHNTSSVIAVTMDITSFYHSIDISEFTEDRFYDVFGLNTKFLMEPKLKLFHESFMNILAEWNKLINAKNGLPIGLSCSPVLANAVMKEFDDSVSEYLSPVYYGRYVDDILLVFPDTGNLKCGDNVIEYLVNKKIVFQDEKEPDELLYKNLVLKKEKQRIFYLDKNADLSILDGIEAEINSISSEWRFLPDIADDSSSLLKKIVGFYADGKEFNDALRKIDATTIKRLGLSLIVSHSHSLNQYINPKEWQSKRFKIYDLVENHMFIPKNFFDNYIFLPRIFRVMIHSNDGERAFCFLQKVMKQIVKLKEAKIKKSSNLEKANFEKFELFNKCFFQEVIFESYNLLNKMPLRYIQKILELLNIDKNSGEILDLNSELFLRDLSFDSYARVTTEYILTKSNNSLFAKLSKKITISSVEIENSKKHLRILNFINSKIAKYMLNKQTLSNIPLLFPTRLFSPFDISIIIPFLKDKNFVKIVNSLRGTHSEINDKGLIKHDNLNIVSVDNKKLQFKKTIDVAITNFKVKDEYWEKSIEKNSIKDLNRFKEIEQIVNEAVKKKPDYLVFPELSLPQEWALLISKKLLYNNISLITGVEYIHSVENINNLKQKIVHNSIMMFLISDNIGFKYMKFYRQDKLNGAYSESIELKNKANIIKKISPMLASVGVKFKGVI